MFVFSCILHGDHITSDPPHPTNTINLAYLTLQRQVKLLTSFAMTLFEHKIKPITTPNYELMHYVLRNTRGCS